MINMRSHETGDLIIQFDVEFPGEKSLEGAELFKVNPNQTLTIFSSYHCIETGIHLTKTSSY